MFLLINISVSSLIKYRKCACLCLLFGRCHRILRPCHSDNSFCKLSNGHWKLDKQKPEIQIEIFRSGYSMTHFHRWRDFETMSKSLNKWYSIICVTSCYGFFRDFLYHQIKRNVAFVWCNTIEEIKKLQPDKFFFSFFHSHLIKNANKSLRSLKKSVHRILWDYFMFTKLKIYINMHEKEWGPKWKGKSFFWHAFIRFSSASALHNTTFWCVFCFSLALARMRAQFLYTIYWLNYDCDFFFFLLCFFSLYCAFHRYLIRA